MRQLWDGFDARRGRSGARAFHPLHTMRGLQRDRRLTRTARPDGTSPIRAIPSPRSRALNSRRKSIMPVKIFVVQGDTLIGGLESEINKWQQSRGSKASVTHISTAMTEHQDEAQDW